MQEHTKIYYHLPGLFEFYEFYKVFLRLYREHREYFYDDCEISSIYGAPSDCMWAGGRAHFGNDSIKDVKVLMREYDISARLTFSNSLINEDLLSDKKCNHLLDEFSSAGKYKNGIIIYSDILLDYIKKYYPDFYFVSSTTKVLREFDDFKGELLRKDFKYVVPDFRLNKAYESLNALPLQLKDKVEFLVNECCNVNCKTRKACYENVSRKNLGEDVNDHICTGEKGLEGYKFSKAMENPMFIGIDDIRDWYLKNGFSNFKIEGRGLGSAVIFEFLLYYMTKPDCQLKVREAVYLDSMLDLF